jgi:hypothetical protein
MVQPAIDFFCSFSLSTRVTRPFGQLARPEICRVFENSVQTPYTAHFRVLSYVSMGIEQQPLLGYQCWTLWTRIVTIMQVGTIDNRFWIGKMRKIDSSD